MPLLRRPPGIRQRPAEDEVPVLRHDLALKQDAKDDMHWDAAQQPWDDVQMGVYTCKSCGGELVCDESTAATACPFCGNPIVLTGRLSGDLKPDYVIPFKLDKKAAEAALRNHMKGKRLLPNLFRSENRISEVKGVYVPFWLFDADAAALCHPAQRRPQLHPRPGGRLFPHAERPDGIHRAV